MIGVLGGDMLGEGVLGGGGGMRCLWSGEPEGDLPEGDPVPGVCAPARPLLLRAPPIAPLLRAAAPLLGLSVRESSSSPQRPPLPCAPPLVGLSVCKSSSSPMRAAALLRPPLKRASGLISAVEISGWPAKMMNPRRSRPTAKGEKV